MKSIYVIAALLLSLIAASIFFLLGENGTEPASSEERAVREYDKQPYVEFINPSGFVNTGGEPITMEQYIGEKVILVDIMTYSCINCQRTFPYLNGWYEKYKDDGLIVIGLHAPEFAFERDIDNVRAAMEKHGITFPIVLDNTFATWNAYGNRYWPHKYLIDIHGEIVYDHIGEGAYEETERMIQTLLAERAIVLGQELELESLLSDSIEAEKSEANSPETYFGALRNEYLANKTSAAKGVSNYTLPGESELNKLYLGGMWNITNESAVSVKDASLTYRYFGKKVFLVARADESIVAEVWQDGVLVGEIGGEDVDENGLMKIRESKLYKVIENPEPGEHLLEIKVQGKGAELYAFTFG